MLANNLQASFTVVRVPVRRLHPAFARQVLAARLASAALILASCMYPGQSPDPWGLGPWRSGGSSPHDGGGVGGWGGPYSAQQHPQQHTATPEQLLLSPTRQAHVLQTVARLLLLTAAFWLLLLSAMLAASALLASAPQMQNPAAPQQPCAGAHSNHDSGNQCISSGAISNSTANSSRSVAAVISPSKTQSASCCRESLYAAHQHAIDGAVLGLHAVAHTLSELLLAAARCAATTAAATAAVLRDAAPNAPHPGSVLHDNADYSMCSGNTESPLGAAAAAASAAAASGASALLTPLPAAALGALRLHAAVALNLAVCSLDTRLVLGGQLLALAAAAAAAAVAASAAGSHALLTTLVPAVAMGSSVGAGSSGAYAAAASNAGWEPPTRQLAFVVTGLAAAATATGGRAAVLWLVLHCAIAAAAAALHLRVVRRVSRVLVTHTTCLAVAAPTALGMGVLAWFPAAVEVDPAAAAAAVRSDAADVTDGGGAISSTIDSGSTAGAGLDHAPTVAAAAAAVTAAAAEAASAALMAPAALQRQPSRPHRRQLAHVPPAAAVLPASAAVWLGAGGMPWGELASPWGALAALPHTPGLHLLHPHPHPHMHPNPPANGDGTAAIGFSAASHAVLGAAAAWPPQPLPLLQAGYGWMPSGPGRGGSGLGTAEYPPPWMGQDGGSIIAAGAATVPAIGRACYAGSVGMATPFAPLPVMTGRRSFSVDGATRGAQAAAGQPPPLAGRASQSPQAYGGGMYGGANTHTSTQVMLQPSTAAAAASVQAMLLESDYVSTAASVSPAHKDDEAAAAQPVPSTSSQQQQAAASAPAHPAALSLAIATDAAPATTAAGDGTDAAALLLSRRPGVLLLQVLGASARLSGGGGGGGGSSSKLTPVLLASMSAMSTAARGSNEHTGGGDAAAAAPAGTAAEESSAAALLLFAGSSMQSLTFQPLQLPDGWHLDTASFDKFGAGFTAQQNQQQQQSGAAAVAAAEGEAAATSSQQAPVQQAGVAAGAPAAAESTQEPADVGSAHHAASSSGTLDAIILESDMTAALSAASLVRCAADEAALHAVRRSAPVWSSSGGRPSQLTPPAVDGATPGLRSSGKPLGKAGGASCELQSVSGKQGVTAATHPHNAAVTGTGTAAAGGSGAAERKPDGTPVYGGGSAAGPAGSAGSDAREAKDAHQAVGSASSAAVAAAVTRGHVSGFAAAADGAPGNGGACAGTCTASDVPASVAGVPLAASVESVAASAAAASAACEPATLAASGQGGEGAAEALTAAAGERTVVPATLREGPSAGPWTAKVEDPAGRTGCVEDGPGPPASINGDGGAAWARLPPLLPPVKQQRPRYSLQEQLELLRQDLLGDLRQPLINAPQRQALERLAQEQAQQQAQVPAQARAQPSSSRVSAAAAQTQQQGGGQQFRRCRAKTLDDEAEEVAAELGLDLVLGPGGGPGGLGGPGSPGDPGIDSASSGSKGAVVTAGSRRLGMLQGAAGETRSPATAAVVQPPHHQQQQQQQQQPRAQAGPETAPAADADDVPADARSSRSSTWRRPGRLCSPRGSTSSHPLLSTIAGFGTVAGSVPRSSVISRDSALPLPPQLSPLDHQQPGAVAVQTGVAAVHAPAHTHSKAQTPALEFPSSAETCAPAQLLVSTSGALRTSAERRLARDGGSGRGRSPAVALLTQLLVSAAPSRGSSAAQSEAATAAAAAAESVPSSGGAHRKTASSASDGVSGSSSRGAAAAGAHRAATPVGCNLSISSRTAGPGALRAPVVPPPAHQAAVMPSSLAYIPLVPVPVMGATLPWAPSRLLLPAAGGPASVAAAPSAAAAASVAAAAAASAFHVPGGSNGFPMPHGSGPRDRRSSVRRQLTAAQLRSASQSYLAAAMAAAGSNGPASSAHVKQQEWPTPYPHANPNMNPAAPAASGSSGSSGAAPMAVLMQHQQQQRPRRGGPKASASSSFLGGGSCSSHATAGGLHLGAAAAAAGTGAAAFTDGTGGGSGLSHLERLFGSNPAVAGGSMGSGTVWDEFNGASAMLQSTMEEEVDEAQQAGAGWGASEAGGGGGSIWSLCHQTTTSIASRSQQSQSHRYQCKAPIGPATGPGAGPGSGACTAGIDTRGSVDAALRLGGSTAGAAAAAIGQQRLLPGGGGAGDLCDDMELLMDEVDEADIISGRYNITTSSMGGLALVANSGPMSAASHHHHHQHYHPHHHHAQTSDVAPLSLLRSAGGSAGTSSAASAAAVASVTRAGRSTVGAVSNATGPAVPESLPSHSGVLANRASAVAAAMASQNSMHDEDPAGAAAAVAARAQAAAPAAQAQESAPGSGVSGSGSRRTTRILSQLALADSPLGGGDAVTAAVGGGGGLGVGVSGGNTATSGPCAHGPVSGNGTGNSRAMLEQHLQHQQQQQQQQQQPRPPSHRRAAPVVPHSTRSVSTSSPQTPVAFAAPPQGGSSVGAAVGALAAVAAPTAALLHAGRSAASGQQQVLLPQQHPLQAPRATVPAAGAGSSPRAPAVAAAEASSSPRYQRSLLQLPFPPVLESGSEVGGGRGGGGDEGMHGPAAAPAWLGGEGGGSGTRRRLLASRLSASSLGSSLGARARCGAGDTQLGAPAAPGGGVPTQVLLSCGSTGGAAYCVGGGGVAGGEGAGAGAGEGVGVGAMMGARTTPRTASFRPGAFLLALAERVEECTK